MITDARYAKDVADVTLDATLGRVAGSISEPIQGVRATTPLADGHVPEVYHMVTPSLTQH